jgi:serine/threonine-protein kinase
MQAHASLHRRRILASSRAVGFAVALGLGLAAAPAWAEPTAEMRAGAAALFEDARRLMTAGKHAEACPKLEESQRIDPGMGTLFNLAACYEAVGRTASAWVGYRDVAVQAAAANQPDREKAARTKASALEAKLMRLKIIAGADTPGLEIRRDGLVVNPALVGTALPLDPGPHTLSASAPGKETWEHNVLLEHPGATVNVEVPPLGDKPAGAPVAVQPSREPAPPPGDGVSPRPWQMPLGITATAVGAVGLGVGTAFGFLAKSAFDASNVSNCNKTTNACNGAGLSQRSDAVLKGNVGTGAFIAGGVLAAAGIVLWATAPKAAAVKVGVGPASVSLRADW